MRASFGRQLLKKNEPLEKWMDRPFERKFLHLVCYLLKTQHVFSTKWSPNSSNIIQSSILTFIMDLVYTKQVVFNRNIQFGSGILRLVLTSPKNWCDLLVNGLVYWIWRYSNKWAERSLRIQSPDVVYQGKMKILHVDSKEIKNCFEFSSEIGSILQLLLHVFCMWKKRQRSWQYN